jgi:hypothetical protein
METGTAGTVEHCLTFYVFRFFLLTFHVFTFHAPRFIPHAPRSTIPITRSALAMRHPNPYTAALLDGQGRAIVCAGRKSKETYADD